MAHTAAHIAKQLISPVTAGGLSLGIANKKAYNDAPSRKHTTGIPASTLEGHAKTPVIFSFYAKLTETKKDGTIALSTSGSAVQTLLTTIVAETLSGPINQLKVRSQVNSETSAKPKISAQGYLPMLLIGPGYRLAQRSSTLLIKEEIEKTPTYKQFENIVGKKMGTAVSGTIAATALSLPVSVLDLFKNGWEVKLSIENAKPPTIRSMTNLLKPIVTSPGAVATTNIYLLSRNIPTFLSLGPISRVSDDLSKEYLPNGTKNEQKWLGLAISIPMFATFHTLFYPTDKLKTENTKALITTGEKIENAATKEDLKLAQNELKLNLKQIVETYKNAYKNLATPAGRAGLPFRVAYMTASMVITKAAMPYFENVIKDTHVHE